MHTGDIVSADEGSVRRRAYVAREARKVPDDIGLGEELSAQLKREHGNSAEASPTRLERDGFEMELLLSRHEWQEDSFSQNSVDLAGVIFLSDAQASFANF